MEKKSKIEKLAVPMFLAGLIGMLASASLSLGSAALARNPVEYKKVTLTYLSTGYSASDSSCGSYSDLYSASSFNDPTFRARSTSSSNSDKPFTCTVTLYVVTNVDLPTPKPAPTVTIIYKTGAPSVPYVTPTVSPTIRPSHSPTPTATRTPTPTPQSTWWIRPTPIPTKSPRP